MSSVNTMFIPNSWTKNTLSSCKNEIKGNYKCSDWQHYFFFCPAQKKKYRKKINIPSQSHAPHVQDGLTCRMRDILKQYSVSCTRCVYCKLTCFSQHFLITGQWWLLNGPWRWRSSLQENNHATEKDTYLEMDNIYRKSALLTLMKKVSAPDSVGQFVLPKLSPSPTTVFSSSPPATRSRHVHGTLLLLSPYCSQ